MYHLRTRIVPKVQQQHNARAVLHHQFEP